MKAVLCSILRDFETLLDFVGGREIKVSGVHQLLPTNRNLCCGDLDHLSTELSLAVRRLRKRPSLIQSFFAGAGLDI